MSLVQGRVRCDVKYCKRSVDARRFSKRLLWGTIEAKGESDLHVCPDHYRELRFEKTLEPSRSVDPDTVEFKAHYLDEKVLPAVKDTVAFMETCSGGHRKRMPGCVDCEKRAGLEKRLRVILVPWTGLT